MKLLTPAELAKRANPPVTPQTVVYWANRGLLPVIRTASGRRLFSERKAMEFLERRAERAKKVTVDVTTGKGVRKP